MSFFIYIYNLFNLFGHTRSYLQHSACQMFSCMCDIVPWQGSLPALGVHGLSYWTTREVPIIHVLILQRFGLEVIFFFLTMDHPILRGREVRFSPSSLNRGLYIMNMYKENGILEFLFWFKTNTLKSICSYNCDLESTLLSLESWSHYLIAL